MATAFGVTTGDALIRFDTATPGTITSSIPITGLQSGETVLGIDFRPVNGGLYGLGSSSRIYAINQVTGAATAVGSAPFSPSLNGTDFGFDFNPVPDRVRVTSNAGQNLRLSADTGTVAATDSALAYAAGDPNFGTAPKIVGSAYSNNFPFATTTTLYAIDSSLDILAIQNPPNAGALITVGALGVDADAILGFDITTTSGTQTGYAALVVAGVPGLYQINLATGSASLIGAIGGGATVRGLAIAPQGFTATLVGKTATFTGTAAAETITFDQAGGLLRHNRFSLGDSGFNSDFDFDSTTPGDQPLSASDPAVSLIVNAGGGDDTFNVGTANSPASLLAASFVLNGEGGNNRAILDDTIDATGRTVAIAPGSVVGIGGPVVFTDLESLTVNAGNGSDQFNILGTLIATSVNAGGGDDTIRFSDAATLSGGFLDGGSGTNTLDYSAYTATVEVDLAPGSTSTLFAALLSGVQEPGPVSPSQASGYGVFQLNAAQTELAFAIAYRKLEGTSLSGAHFHNQAVGVNGPIVRDIAGSELNGSTVPAGLLAGTWLSTDSQALTPALIAELFAGRISVNLPTLPNQPSGEIRGQLFMLGTVNPATGTAGVRGFDNIIGGSAADSLIGNSNANVIHGGAGADTIVGGPGNDQLFGDGDNDLFIWNNGDGSDVIDGGAGVDTVRVNGSPTEGDQFLLQVNPNDSTRLRFDRTNLGLFNLDIGTIEHLEFNTLDGDDTTTIEFAGGNPIPANGIQFDGGLGNDRLVLQRSAGTFTATNESYTALNPTTGLINLDGSTISFAGLEPIDDTVPAASFTFNAPAGPQSINVVNGPTIGGFATTQIHSAVLPPAFELINFANKTNAILNTSLGNDTVVVNNPVAATGLTGLTINTNGGADLVTLVATPPGVATVVNTGSEDDLVSLSASSLGAGGTTFLDGGPGTDTLRFDAQNQPYTVTPTSLTFNGQVVNFINFEAIQITNTGTNPVVPVLPPLPINAIEGTQVVDVIVARFTDADFGAKAADYVTTIAWGDGTSSSGIVTQDASNPSLFYVTGTHLYREQGSLFVTTTIADRGTTTTTTVGGVTITTISSAPPVNTTSPVTVADAPIVAVGATVSGPAGTAVTSLVASFTTTDPDATPGDFLTMINWGDGSVPSVGTISVVGSLPNGLTFRVMGTHTYFLPGVYAVTTTIASIGGSATVANGTAVIAETDRPVPLFGQLQLASDTGISNTDGITRDNTPTFVGTGQPGSVVRVSVGTGDPATRLYIASAVTNAAGVWEATVLQPLADGTYSSIAAEATSRAGVTTSALIMNRLIIDTVGPKVTDLILDRLSGRIGVAFQDDRSGLDQFGLVDGANYRFAGLVLVGARRNTPILITNASTTASNNPTAAQSVTLTLNRGRQIRGGKFTFTVLSGGIQDVAGNGLDGDFYGFFPSGNNRPGGDFVAQVDSIHRVVSAPIPIQNGSASPLTPPGRPGQRFVLGAGTNRFQSGNAVKKPGQAHPTGPKQGLKAVSYNPRNRKSG
ncbi:DUF4394 domain-containing protein [Singulisphaera sp. GP187]|uniref:DUF4394 domain-containing protein n=1 Tax=Singulisphaera sp. GP187 TaxID=1882752 RepID=UPI0013566CD0|nr:DUF4394 domain-containing protein [Singulisphaera sp. GP187]